MTTRGPFAFAVLTLAAVLVVTIAIAAASATWHAFGHYPEIKPQRAATFDPPPPIDLASILALSPFGVAATVEGPLQASSANLVLRGVILTLPMELSTALISDAGNVPSTIAVGETLPGGAILDEVAADHVVLLVAGRREILSFPETLSTDGVAAIRAGIPGAFTGPAVPPAQSLQETIDVYRQKIADNPQDVLNEFSVSATAEGYRVADNIAPAVRRAGLAPGDLVVRVNGVAVGNLEQDRKLFEDVAASGRARVEVLRGDRLLILSFPLR